MPEKTTIKIELDAEEWAEVQKIAAEYTVQEPDQAVELIVRGLILGWRYHEDRTERERES